MTFSQQAYIVGSYFLRKIIGHKLILENVITEMIRRKTKHTVFSVQAVRCIPISVTIAINFSRVGNLFYLRNQ